MNGPGLSPIARTVTRLLTPFILLYGLYIIAYGHLTPGGGFPGGVMIATGFILLVLTLGRRKAEQALPRPVAGVLDSVGAFAFLLIALLGLWLGGTFFLNFIQKADPGDAHEVFNAGTVPLANVAIALKVAMSFAAVFVVLAAARLSGGGRFESDEEE
jgi:multicomponent Na+:H+ antiporter subunit B